MKVVIQRVKKASVAINSNTVATISTGLLILLGIVPEDNQEDVDWLCAKISKLRIFGDDKGVMNLSVQDINGAVIVVSQFTLHALTKKGNRPSYIKAARPEQAIPMYESFKKTLSNILKKEIQSGKFGADMQVSLVNDGPVTLIIDSKQR